MRTYGVDGIGPCLNCMEGGNLEPHIGIKVIGKTYPNMHSVSDIHSADGIMSCCTIRDYKQPKQIAIPGLTPDRAEKGIYVEMPGGFLAYCVWYEKYQCYIAIRKLTPKECFRLQGWTDDYFEKAAFVNSDSQLYKQAGNGVTVDVVKAIGDKIMEYEKVSVRPVS